MRLTIPIKLFLGFLIIICFNILYILPAKELSYISNSGDNLLTVSKFITQLNHLDDLHNDRTRIFVAHRAFIGGEAQKFVQEFDALSHHITQEIDSLREQADSLHLPTERQQKSFQQIHAYLDSISIKNEQYMQLFIQAHQLSDLTKRPNRAQIREATTPLSVTIKSLQQIIQESAVIKAQFIQGNLQNIKKKTFLILLCIIIFSLLFALLFSKFLTKHLHRLKRATEDIGKGDFQFAATKYPNDEIGDLARSFFDMAIDLQTKQEELIQKRKLAAVGAVAASVNHEINNPLMVISGNAQFLELSIEQGKLDDAKKRIDIILGECDRISEVTRQLKDMKQVVIDDYTSSGEIMIDLKKSAEK